MDPRRRNFLKAGACFAFFQGGSGLFSAHSINPNASSQPIIDAHIHLFDPTRPAGVPWPDKADTIYRPALPDRYRSLAAPFGVIGAVAVECSPWVADNDWLLRTAAADTIIVGIIGNLDPATPDFAQRLEGLQQNPLFRGIRYGNLWGRNLGAQLSNPDFVTNLKRLAAAGLLLESANPNPVLIADLLRLTGRIPELRIVIDHLPQALPPEEPGARKAYLQDLRALGQRDHVFVKASEVLRRVHGSVPADMDFYQPWLDQIWRIFGEDRLLYGSDWPNSDHLEDYAGTLGIIRQYVASKGPIASEKFFWRNSIAVYRWRHRNQAQARLTRAEESSLDKNRPCADTYR